MRPNMKLMLPSGISRRALLSTLAALAVFSMLLFTAAQAQTDPLSFWNDGPAKQAIIELVKATTDRTSPQFVPPEARIATFDQDGTRRMVVGMTKRRQAVIDPRPTSRAEGASEAGKQR